VLNQRREDCHHPLSFSGHNQFCYLNLGLTLDARGHLNGCEIESVKIYFTGVALRWSRMIVFVPPRSSTFTFHRSIGPFANVEPIK
jgi:hypothetical protein